MRLRSLLPLLFAMSFACLASCGDDDDATTTDTGPRTDTGAPSDLGTPSDSGPTTDAGPTPTDSGPTPTDSGPIDSGATDSGPADSGPIEPDAAGDRDAMIGACGSDGLGDFCEGTPCRSGFECMVGRCVPQARMICGGFAGAECTDPLHPVCLYFSTADFGPCFTPAEAECLCARARDSFSCGP